METDKSKTNENRRGTSALTRLLGTRERKYRLWDGESLEYFENWHELISLARIMQDNFDNDFFVVTEFTGQKDMNGDEIYEGDVIEYIYIDEMEENGVGSVKNIIGFRNSCFCWKGENTREWFPLFEEEMGNEQLAGNVFEHPELIDECT